jgi:hypothetical protein
MRLNAAKNCESYIMKPVETKVLLSENRNPSLSENQ